MEKLKEIGWFIFFTIMFGFIGGNCVGIPILYFMGFEMTLLLSLQSSAAVAVMYVVYGIVKTIKK